MRASLFFLARLFLQIPGDVSINNELGMGIHDFRLWNASAQCEKISICVLPGREFMGPGLFAAHHAKGKYIADQGHRRG